MRGRDVSLRGGGSSDLEAGGPGERGQRLLDGHHHLPLRQQVVELPEEGSIDGQAGHTVMTTLRCPQDLVLVEDAEVGTEGSVDEAEELAPLAVGDQPRDLLVVLEHVGGVVGQFQHVLMELLGHLAVLVLRLTHPGSLRRKIWTSSRCDMCIKVSSSTLLKRKDFMYIH